MNPLSRDARHLALAQIGKRGQQQIASGSALVVGVGGIGCAVATYLASSGVGKLLIVDFDTVDETNLGRQILYTQDDIGNLKADVAVDKLRASNPNIEITTLAKRLADDEMRDVVASVDIVLDGCDNFTTRFQVNDACVAAGRTLISGAAIRLEGQLAVFGPDYARSPCYRCLYTEADESLDSCAGNGVLSPVPGVIGTMMAVEALKVLASFDVTAPKLTLFDAARTEFQTLTIRKREDCPACATGTEQT